MSSGAARRSSRPTCVKAESNPAPTDGPGSDRFIRTMTHLLDELVPIPGTRMRVGLDGLVGLFLPGLGDLAGGLTSGLILLQAVRRGAPKVVLVRMLGNVALDSLVGIVPILGDAFDLAFKSNRRNLRLLERIEHGDRQATAGDYAFLLLLLALLIAIVAIPVTLLVLLVHRLATTGPGA